MTYRWVQALPEYIHYEITEPSCSRLAATGAHCYDPLLFKNEDVIVSFPPFPASNPAHPHLAFLLPVIKNAISVSIASTASSFYLIFFLSRKL